MSKFVTVAAIATLTISVAAPLAAKKAQRAPADPGELILFQETDYNGDYYTIDSERTSVQTEWNIRSIGLHTGEKWQICAKPRFREPCIELTESLDDASKVGIHGQIGSARRTSTGE